MKPTRSQRNQAHRSRRSYHQKHPNSTSTHQRIHSNRQPRTLSHKQHKTPQHTKISNRQQTNQHPKAQSKTKPNNTQKINTNNSLKPKPHPQNQHHTQQKIPKRRHQRSPQPSNRHTPNTTQEAPLQIIRQKSTPRLSTNNQMRPQHPIRQHQHLRRTLHIRQPKSQSSSRQHPHQQTSTT